jgi:hypothetical protein
MFVFETHTISRPDIPTFLTNLINPVLGRLGNRQPYLPFQAILVARRIAISIFIAVAQIAPRLLQSQPTSNDPQALQMNLNKLYGIVSNMDNDVDRLLRLETVPFFNDDEVETRLKMQLKSWLVQNEVRNAPEVDSAIQNVLLNRRVGTNDDL